VGALDIAVDDVEDERHPAVVVGGAVVERHVAGAHEVARAGLEVAPLQAPGHWSLPRLSLLGLVLPIAASRCRIFSPHVTRRPLIGPTCCKRQTDKGRTLCSYESFVSPTSTPITSAR